MKKIYLFIAGLLIVPAAFAQKAIFYEVYFPNAAHHEAHIIMTIPEAPAGTIKVRMSRSSAGRYATAEFGKNIYNVKAFNVDSSAVAIKQIEGDVYEISQHDATVKISYTLYANWVDGTYAGIDQSHAHLNMPATFMWVIGQDSRPLKFQFNDLEKYGWQVATQLKHEGVNVYSAPNLQYMMDSPTELSDYKLATWDVVNTDGKKQTLHLATHSADTQPVIDNFAKMVQKVVLEEKAVYGELPVYDYGEYTFLQDTYPTNSGDGMEHRNSTCIVEGADKVEGNEVRMLSTFSHEYFHSWNVKRIRPKSLEPFNFEHADMSGELWFAEGFTQYYGELLLVRAGFHNTEDYTRTLGGLVNSVLNTPAAARYSPIQMSNYAVFADAGVSIDATNQGNIFTSYYLYGGATALALDMRLRSEFNITLDDYMRQVWLDYGKPYIPYTIADLQKSLTKVTNKVFAADFFKRYIYGFEKNNYEALLAKAGLILRKAQPGKAWAGSLFVNSQRGRSGQVRAATDNGFALTSNTTIGTPIYKAGLDVGDVITMADGKNIKDAQAFADVIAGKQIGDKVAVTYTDRAGEHQTTIILAENPALEVVTFEADGKTPTSDQTAFRAKWLSSKVK